MSQVQILDGNTFVVSDDRGDIEATPTDTTGLFSYDTRFLSKWVLTVDGERLNPLSVDDLNYFEARFFLVPGTGTIYVNATLSVIRQRAVGDGVPRGADHPQPRRPPADITCGSTPTATSPTCSRSRTTLGKKGKYYHRVAGDHLLIGYERETFRRETTIVASAPAQIDENGLTFTLHIEPHARVDHRPRRGHGPARLGRTPPAAQVQPDSHAEGEASDARPNMALSLERWLADAPTLETDQDSLKATYRRSLIDLAALRFSPPVAGGLSLPAAGLPWFMAMFGRDSILTSLQALPFAPELAAATLRALGAWQGSRVDDFREEEPGRILHEMRYGETAAFEEQPHSPYYGNADATPLFVVLLDEYERWSGDRTLVTALEPQARAALNWITEYGDRQGNGYISYERTRDTGLENQCWKDSWDSISYHDGRLPGFPRATCELQGYAYDALVRGARLAREVWKDPDYAEALEKQAADLKRRFNRDFWVQDGQFFAIALESDGTRVDSLTSNIGHLLWSGIVDKSKAKPLVEAPDGPEAVERLGRAHAGRGRGAVQPDRLPHGRGVAVRQLVHRLGPAAVRLQDRGGPRRQRHPRRGRLLRRPAARGVRRLRARRSPASRCSTRPRAARRPGPPARRCSCCAPCSACSRPAST